MLDKIFWKVFAQRSAVCFFLILALLFSCALRVAVITSSNYGEVQMEMSSLKIKIANQRGTIFDCNMKPITNNQKKIIACISPTPNAITKISEILEGEELQSVLEALKDGKPVTCEVPRMIESEDIIFTEIYSTENKIPAIHTVGYADSEGNGVNGIEKAYDNILGIPSPIFIRYACDGKGKILPGVTPKTENTVSPDSNAVITTIDIDIQNIIEPYATALGKGAIIVADAKNSKIRGILSAPNFTTDAVSDLLNESSSPLFNRTIGAYNVGSVFKPCVAAAGIEKNYDYFCYECTGNFEIIDRAFNCHLKSGHSVLDLENAIANSCNTYFYNFSFLIGKESILKMADSLNFGRRIKLGNGIYTAEGTLPSNEKLNNLAHLANLSIGQGDFTASPISLLPLYSAIANKGKYYLPSIIEATIKNSVKTNYDIGSPSKAISEQTAEKLKTALWLVVNEGTGTLANPKTVTAAGKTATAQTGKYKNGKEIKSSWFCGFFPRENPEYVVIVFCEDTTVQTKSSAEIFAEIADKINSLE